MSMIKTLRSGITAISLVISLIIIAVLAIFAIYYYRGQADSGPGNLQSPMERVRNVECLAQARKIDTEVQIYYVREGIYPTSLLDLTGLAESDLYCPVTKSQYLYDPATGQVHCPDHIR
jgi:hypothetical protein